ncbi:hypothetical protein JXM83_04030 [Candidatus Woesearchaeota archaeon]|nr:hypothetical protein [Candidatus Woesearchaeota archaeon]
MGLIDKLKSISMQFKPEEPKIVTLFDLDETLKKHSSIEIALYKFLIESSINSANPILKSVLKGISHAYAPLSRNEMYYNSQRVAKELSKVGQNFVYTLSSKKTAQIFLDRNCSQHYFSGIINVPQKSPEVLTEHLSYAVHKYPEKINEDYVVILLGDSRCDITKPSGIERVISIGLESGIGNQQGQLENISDIFIPQYLRKREDFLMETEVFAGLKKELIRVGISKKTDIFKKITELESLYAKYAEEARQHYNERRLE